MKKILVLITVFMLTGCGCSKKAEAPKTPSITGSYNLIELYDGIETINRETLEEVEAVMTLDVSDNATASLTMGDEVIQFRYDENNFYVTDDEEVMEYRQENNNLILKKDESMMIFERK